MGDNIARVSSLLDVAVERIIAAPPDRVARVMLDPAYDVQWMRAVKTAEPVAGSPTRAVRRTARFLGRTISWTTEVADELPGRRLHMRIANGPFVGEVFYEIEPHARGSLVRIRNVGAPGQFAWLPRSLIVAAMRRGLQSDLANLEREVTLD